MGVMRIGGGLTVGVAAAMERRSAGYVCAGSVVET